MDFIAAEKTAWKIKSAINRILRPAFSFCFGREACLGCGSIVYSMPLCKDCRKRMEDECDYPAKRCQCCGKILLSEENLCLQCRKEKLLKHCDSCLPLFSYRLWNKDLLTLWKLGGNRSLSSFYARLIFEKAIDRKIPVVPVPPRRGKVRKKGWDQIQELCFCLKNDFSCEIFQGLERISSVQQKKLNREERLKNTNSGFILSKNYKKQQKKGLLPKEVYLLDDVITTGSTVESCAMLLKENGVQKVHVLSLFIVD